MHHHVACAGQTIGDLAKAYGCSAEELARVNGVAVDTPLVAGVIIWIPGMAPREGPEVLTTGFPEAAASPETVVGLPVLRLPATIFTALRRHAERNEAGRLMLQLRPAGEADVTHLHLPGNSQS